MLYVASISTVYHSDTGTNVKRKIWCRAFIYVCNKKYLNLELKRKPLTKLNDFIESILIVNNNGVPSGFYHQFLNK